MPLPVDGYGLLPVNEVALEPLAAFRCGKQHLDMFLVRQAPEWHQKRLGFTTVVFHRDVQGVVGYFTLANDALPLTSSEQLELDLDISLSAYPAVKLGRLAVSSDLQGQGVGEQLMGFVHGEVLESSSLSAARLVILDADNAEDDRGRVLSAARISGFALGGEPSQASCRQGEERRQAGHNQNDS